MNKREMVKAGWVSAALMLVPLRGGMVGMPDKDPSILEVADSYPSAMLAGDPAAAAGLYQDDAVEMPPGKPPVRGRAAIERYYRELFGGCRFTEFVLVHTELRASGDVAYAAGTSRSPVAPNGGPPIEDAGKYLVVLKRTGGRWWVAYAISNSDRH